MKLTMNEMDAFQKFYRSVADQSMSFSTSYKLNKLSRLIKEESAFFSQKMDGIIQEYGKFDDNGNPIYSENGTSILIKEDKLEECGQKIEELNNLVVDIDDITFGMDEFEKIEVAPELVEGVMGFMA